jgi:hypothetical protein
MSVLEIMAGALCAGVTCCLTDYLMVKLLSPWYAKRGKRYDWYQRKWVRIR